MKTCQLLISILLLLATFQVKAQIDSTQLRDFAEEESTLAKPEINEQLKVGIKLGVGACSLWGDELSNPQPTLLLCGGAYVRYRFTKHSFVQPEVNITFRGSNFNNGALEYEGIKIYYLDIPVLWLYGLNEKNTRALLVGMQYSRLLNASIFIKDELIPQTSSPQLKKNDLSAILGAQFQTPFVGFQFAIKYGLININDGLLPNLNPPNTGKDIHNIALELTMLF